MYENEKNTMIRKIKPEELDDAIKIINDNWGNLYKHYVNPILLSEKGRRYRKDELENEIKRNRPQNYVYIENDEIKALLTIGETSDEDRKGAFEIWRVYVSLDAQKKGIGSKLLAFAQKEAAVQGYHEIVIWAFEKNIKAVCFYKKFGFEIDKIMNLGETFLTTGIRLYKSLNENK